MHRSKDSKVIYILPPSTLSAMLERYKENFIDSATRRPYLITSLRSDEHLKLVDNSKLITHRYIFALVLYAGHWWMYSFDKVEKTFFVIDSRPKDHPSPDRTKINRFAGNMIDQLLVMAGYHTLLAKATRSKPAQISWFPRYVKIHAQPNAYDCGTFVMKWTEVLDPTMLDAHTKYPIDDWTNKDLQRFRDEIMWQIIRAKTSSS